MNIDTVNESTDIYHPQAELMPDELLNKIRSDSKLKAHFTSLLFSPAKNSGYDKIFPIFTGVGRTFSQ